MATEYFIACALPYSAAADRELSRVAVLLADDPARRRQHAAAIPGFRGLGRDRSDAAGDRTVRPERHDRMRTLARPDRRIAVAGPVSAIHTGQGARGAKLGDPPLAELRRTHRARHRPRPAHGDNLLRPDHTAAPGGPSADRAAVADDRQQGVLPRRRRGSGRPSCLRRIQNDRGSRSRHRKPRAAGQHRTFRGRPAGLARTRRTGAAPLPPVLRAAGVATALPGQSDTGRNGTADRAARTRIPRTLRNGRRPSSPSASPGARDRPAGCRPCAPAAGTVVVGTRVHRR